MCYVLCALFQQSFQPASPSPAPVQAPGSPHVPQAYPTVGLSSQMLEVTDSSLLPHERVSQDGSGFSRILGMIGEPGPQTTEELQRRQAPVVSSNIGNIEDEEEFLYGDKDTDPTQPCGLGTPARLPGDSQTSAPLVALSGMPTPLQQFKALLGDPSMSHIFKQAQSALAMTSVNRGIPATRRSATPEQEKEASAHKHRAGSPAKNHREETPSSAEFERVKSLLKNMGLALSTAEISKIASKLRDVSKRSSHESSHSSSRGE